MLSPRWRKVLRDLWSYKSRTLLVVLSIAVGVFAVGTVAHTHAIISQEMATSYPASNPASATLVAEPFDDELVQTIRKMPAVADAEARSTLIVRVQLGPELWQPMRLFAIPDYADIRINKVWPEHAAQPNSAIDPQRSRWPPDDHEILFERASLLMPGLVPAHLKLDDGVVIETPEGKQRSLRVAGLAHEPSRNPATFAGMAYGYITYDTLEWLGQPRDFNELSIVVADGADDKAHITEVAQLVRDKIERSGRTVSATYVPEPHKFPLDDIFRGISLLLGALGLMSLFLSGFLVVNTIGALLTQQVRQIGVMKALGAQTQQITAMYLGMVAVFGALALIVAIPLGAGAARVTTALMASFVNINAPHFSIPAHVLAMEILFGLCIPLLAALAPIISNTRKTIREALAGQAASTAGGRANLIDALLSRVRGLSRPLMLSLRNSFRRKVRLALTLATLSLAGAIFIAVLSVRESLLLTLDDALDYWQFDVQADLMRPYRAAALEHEVQRIPGVAVVESWGATSVRRLRPDDSESDTLTIYAPPAGSAMLKPTVIAGRWLLPEDDNAVVINTKLAEAEALHVGDELTLKFGERELRWRVVGVIQMVGAASSMMYTNYDYYVRAVGEVGRASSLRIVTTQHDAVFQTQVKQALDERFSTSGVHLAAAQTLAEIRQQNEVYFSIIIGLLLVMAVLLAGVGSLGLAGTMSINVLERTREIGVMRAIGASSGMIMRIVVVEGVVIGVLSWIVSLLLALPLSKLLCDAVGAVFFQVPLSFQFSLPGAAIWLVLIGTIAAIASCLPAWNAARLTVRAVLAYE